MSRCSILGRKQVIPDKKPILVQRRDQEKHVTHQSIDITNSIAQEQGGKCLSTEYVKCFGDAPKVMNGLQLFIE